MRGWVRRTALSSWEAWSIYQDIVAKTLKDKYINNNYTYKN